MITKSRPKTIIAICQHLTLGRAFSWGTCRFSTSYAQYTHKKGQLLYGSRVFIIRDRGIRVVKNSRKNSNNNV